MLVVEWIGSGFEVSWGWGSPALFFKELLGLTSADSAHVHLTDGEPHTCT